MAETTINAGFSGATSRMQDTRSYLKLYIDCSFPSELLHDLVHRSP